ncbi:MAG: glycine--tRNA ligase subunit beta [Alphaproteobacteria bacterium]
MPKNKMSDIVIELFFEELPASEQKRLKNYFAKNWLAEKENKRKILIGPRRIALLGYDLTKADLEKTEWKKGPRTTTHQDILAKFLSAHHLKKPDLKIDGDFYFYKKHIDIKNWLTMILEDKNLFSKTMIWQAISENKKINQWRAIRPLRQIIVQIDDKPMAGNILWAGQNMVLSQKFIGHRALGGDPFSLSSAKNYASAMKKHFIEFTKNIEGISVPDDINKILSDKLDEKNLYCKQKDMSFMYDEVLPLVEYPFYMFGTIDEKFMALPAEVITSTIKHHQKFIPLYDKKTHQLSPEFLIIANNGGSDNKTTKILAGYQRVLRARLADIDYFLKEDLKHNLYGFREQLKKRLFFKNLGNLYDKTERIKKIATDYQKIFSLGNDDDVITASELCKADLASQLVNELPELQGIIGGYYAKQQGWSYPIATAIKEQYLPHPLEKLSALINFADRLDNLIEFFRIEKMPTGSSDPFALRRSAFYIMNILIEHKIDITLKQLSLSQPLTNFLQERLLSYLETTENLNHLVLSIIKKQSLSKPPYQLNLLAISIKKIDLSPIIEITKRSINIVEKNHHTIDKNLLQEPAEKKIYESLEQLDKKLQCDLKNDNMIGAVQSIANIQNPLNEFFDKILINHKDEAIKTNRHALIHQFLILTRQVGDFSL